ncbi:MAG: SoxR reducing system RseC family protein [Nitrosomonadales bacterium]|nr:SoxR reducing system RseC family protein [Nitrosomonadales bacterium]
MISAPVRVISADNGTAQVESTGQSGCGVCQSRESCGVSGLGKYFSGKRKAIEVRCSVNVRAGDELQLSLSEGDLLKAGLLAYLLPTVLALVGAGIAAAFGLGDVGAALGAANGMAAGFLLGRLSGWAPRMVAQRKE